MIQRGFVSLQTWVLAQDSVTVSPDKDGLPLVDRIADMVNGFAFVMLLCCLVGLMAGGGLMWAGSTGSNTRMQGIGKTAVLASFAGAFLIGGAATIINFASNQGA